MCQSYQQVSSDNIQLKLLHRSVYFGTRIRMVKLIFIILCIVPLISGQCNQYTAKPRFKRAVYDFTVDLISRINLDTDSHFVASSLSVWSLISSLSFGASEETLSEIEKVLKLHPHVCFNKKYFEFIKRLHSVKDEAIESSSSLFVDDKMTLKETFRRNVEKSGLCEVQSISFDDFESAAATINQYVTTATHEAIDEIVSPSDLDGVLLVMIDALFFKGTWKVQFPYEDTEASAFYSETGNQIGDVNLMFATNPLNVTSIDAIQAKVLELPYHGDRFSMLVFLPYSGASVTTMIDHLKRISLDSIFILFEQNQVQSVAVQLPRFKISSDINNLKELLSDMGLRSMFNINSANFGGISDYQLHVANLIQKADVYVTEEGTVASAVSEAAFESRMLPEQFTVNRPFLFMIIDRELQVPLFTAAYSKPTLY